MDKPKTTPKDFFLWAGAMLSLYISVVSFISLIFNYIDYAFPNSLSYAAGDPYQSGVGHEMATLIILFPLFLILFWLIHRDIRHDASRSEIWVRRWALVLTLFVAGATMVIDLIILLTAFFNGESLTSAFLLKVVIVLLVAAAAFMHFIADLWGYWGKNPRYARSVGWATALLIVLTVGAGFLIIGTPEHARLILVDEQKVSDLQSIQSQVMSYWQQEGILPQNLSELSNSISGYSAPTDEQSGQPYGYQTVNTTSFELCATFNTQDYSGASLYAQPEPMGMYDNSASDNWGHGAGQQCFIRTIDPSRYPPTTNQ